MAKPWKIDVPVLLIFFARPDVFEKVFESVREARPSTLLLWQDGPREGRPDDVENIEKCRKIAENIDWECTVYRMYNEQNYGCDPSTFYSHKWAFSIVDKCIILEDDRIPSQSFYPYCKYLLDKYENDTRINHICGTNLLGVYEDCPGDYFFAPCGSTAWATWKRVADSWDEKYLHLDDEYNWRCLERLYGKDYKQSWYHTALRHKNTGIPYWETVLGSDALLHSRLAIIPKKNMVTDIGTTENATHTNAYIECLPKAQQAMFDMERHEITFPLQDPQHIVADMHYMDRLSYISGFGHPFLQIKYKLTYYAKCLFYGHADLIWKSIGRKRKKH
ncbi:MAG: hypothetical protein IJO72_06090 [Oscillospiraceae bacterium]|nr:hypothetical protein [Oscillospiraceae bacterium]MBQ9930330.1 hypothetical protein [Oscillospiraceae bacterium]